MNSATILIAMPMKPGDPTEHTYAWSQKAVDIAKNLGYDVKTLEKDDTTYDKVTSAIKKYKPRLFASFSHGCPSNLQGQNECMITRKFTADELIEMADGSSEKKDIVLKMLNPLASISEVGVLCDGICNLNNDICSPLCEYPTNINELRGSIVYATACFTAKQLGTCSIKYGVQCYVGYNDLLMFPVDSLKSQDMFGEVQLEFYKSLLMGKSVFEAEQNMIALEDSYIRKYKKVKYISLPMLWNKMNRRVLGDTNASIYG